MLAAVVLPSLLAASCGGATNGGAASTTTTTPPAATTTTAPATTTTSTTLPPTTTTTTTVPPTTTTTTEPLPYSTAVQGESPGPLEGSEGWDGSGCSPGSGPLPDGVWFGFVRAASPWDVTFDLACLHWAADVIPDGGWEFANLIPTERTVAVDPSALVVCPWAACPANPATYPRWVERVAGYLERNPTTAGWTADQDDPTQGLGVWLYVNGGRVTEIVEPVLAG